MMADGTGIEWADATWQPTLGCQVITPGCTNCYAMKMAHRHEAMCKALGRTSPYAGLTRQTKAGAVWNGEVRPANDAALRQPQRWRKPRRIFVDSMADLFAEGVYDDWIDRAFAIMALANWHTYMVLTKRPERMRKYVSQGFRGPMASWMNRLHPYFDGDGALITIDDWPLPNVWLGTSVEDQRRADERIPELLATPAAKRFLSCEPLLGPLDLTTILRTKAEGFARPLDGSFNTIDLVIAGGESGRDARPMHPNWVRSIRDQCVDAGVSFFFKQWGEWTPHKPMAGGDLGGDVRAGRVCCVHPSGRDCVEISRGTNGMRQSEPGSRYMARLGKKAAGAMLDGREWREIPDV